MNPSYAQQIEELGKRAILWSARNPDRAPIVKWNWPRSVMVIGTWSGIRGLGLVELNEDAEDLVAAMLANLPPEREPTPLMVRIAIELWKEHWPPKEARR